MTAAADTRPAEAFDVPDRRDGGGMALRSRLAGLGLALVLLAISGFALWSSQVAASAAQRVDRTSQVYDLYREVATAVLLEESLERKYRLEPGPEVRAAFSAAADRMGAALDGIARLGGAEDRATVARLRPAHRDYLRSMAVLFDAVDAGDQAAVLRADVRTDAIFEAIERNVEQASTRRRAEAQLELGRLRDLEAMTGQLTPVVFLVGLLLALLLSSVTRRYRRLLDRERAQALHQSLHDMLTGLPNRALLSDRFEQSLRAARREGSSTGLLLIDVDRFKEINDTFGHHYGDRLLTQIGPRLAESLREVDTVARLGGDEFAVLLPRVRDVAAALAIAEKLRTALETPFHVDGVALDIEASIGVVLSGEHGEDAATLLQRADIAMYVAKDQNLGVFAYDPAVDDHSPARLALLGELRRALDRGELVLHYQPKVSVHTGDVVGVEALVRWHHPDRGLVLPGDFIGLAEQTGLIGPLTVHVLELALAQARSWSDAGRPLTVSVNLSARNLLDERLPDRVADLLADHGVNAELLKIEVTESAIMTEPARAQRLLERLAAIGVRISIDDFGAGYTSLGQLKNLPVTELKIDRSFVMTMTEDRSNALIVHSVVDLGHNLGLTIVAEGVEDARALGALADFGCDVAQGYHLSRPLPAEAFDAWYLSRPAVAAKGVSPA